MLDPLPRLGHRLGDDLFATQIVARLLAFGEVFLGPVGFVKEESGRIFLGLQHVESDIARL